MTRGKMIILGINAYHGDVSAVLLLGGESLAAVGGGAVSAGETASVFLREVITLRPLARVCGQRGEDVRGN